MNETISKEARQYLEDLKILENKNKFLVTRAIKTAKRLLDLSEKDIRRINRKKQLQAKFAEFNKQRLSQLREEQQKLFDELQSQQNKGEVKCME